MYRTLVILFGLVLSFQVEGQVYPKEGSKLNYRIIGFSFPKIAKERQYTIQIAKGTYSRLDSFSKNIIQTEQLKANRKIIEVPALGCQYTWCIVYTENKEQERSQLYHFSTQTCSRADTTKFHIRILQPAAEKYKDNYVSVDGGGVLYDMKGVPVWFIPDSNEYGGFVADLKFTDEGTITFIYKTPYVIDYCGNVLWKPLNTHEVSRDTLLGEMYHHEFTRLSNGHYMALGTKILPCKLSTKDSSYEVTGPRSPNDGVVNIRFGTLIEYDEKGDVVWSWVSSKYLLSADLAYYEANIDSLKRFDPHENAFFFDEKNKCIYLGFRNMNRIIKIAYPGGNVLSAYGENYKPGVPQIGANLFCNQHTIGRTKDGYLYIFENNSCRIRDSLPTVVLLQEPVLPGDGLKKVKEYECTVDGLYPPGYPKIFGSGGNAKELPDGSFFINMGSEYSKLFIVDRSGEKVQWSALAERFMETDEKWTTMHEYRANIINRKDLERMIWRSENTHVSDK